MLSPFLPFDILGIVDRAQEIVYTVVMTNVVKFTNSAVTVDEALDLASKVNYKEVLILGYDENDELYVVCNKMTNKDAIWILRNAEL